MSIILYLFISFLKRFDEILKGVEIYLYIYIFILLLLRRRRDQHIAHCWTSFAARGSGGAC